MDEKSTLLVCFVPSRPGGGHCIAPAARYPDRRTGLLGIRGLVEQAPAAEHLLDRIDPGNLADLHALGLAKLPGI